MFDLRQQPKGFTLIELLVAMAIFTGVLTTVVGTLLVLVNANARAQNIQAAMTNLNFALDSMTREIRTGSRYYCKVESGKQGPSSVQDENDTSNCSTGNYLEIVEGGNSLTGAGATGKDRRISYYFSKDYYDTGHGAILRRIGDPTGQAWFPITSKNIKIENMRFVVRGTNTLNDGSDTEPATVTLWLMGSAGDLAETDVTYAINTTVTQRLLDI